MPDGSTRTDPDPQESTELLLPSGLESGTAFGDRAFRPDVEGLRAVAVTIVVLFHAGIQLAPGGFVGVDIFFVISGFVITGVFLRQSEGPGKIRFLDFYARRARRLVPMALVVIVFSVVATGIVGSHLLSVWAASDARWSATFLANFHFNLVNHSLDGVTLTPLAHYWSLAVEEQFYLVYPAFFVAILSMGGLWSLRTRLFIALSLVAGISLVSSALTSPINSFAGYYVTYNRVWELAVGALLAVSTRQLQRMPRVVAGALSWIGIAGIVYSTQVLWITMGYPGLAALLPVLSTAAVIAGGTAVPRWGAETVLRTPPFKWVGRWSYSWYLWHFALFFVIETAIGKYEPSLSNWQRIGLVLSSLAVAALSYFFIENPIRRSKRLAQSPRATLIGAAVLIASCVLFTYLY